MNRDKLLETMQTELTKWFKREFTDSRLPDGEMGEDAEIHFTAFRDGRDVDTDDPLFSLVIKTSRSINAA